MILKYGRFNSADEELIRHRLIVCFMAILKI
jgi:hypothetical protein